MSSSRVPDSSTVSSSFFACRRSPRDKSLSSNGSLRNCLFFQKNGHRSWRGSNEGEGAKNNLVVSSLKKRFLPAVTLKPSKYDFLEQFMHVLPKNLPEINKTQGASVSERENFVEFKNCSGVVRSFTEDDIEVWTPDYDNGTVVRLARESFRNKTDVAVRLGMWLLFDASGSFDSLYFTSVKPLTDLYQQQLNNNELKVETTILHCGIKTGEINPTFVAYSNDFGLVLDKFERLADVFCYCFLKCWITPLYKCKEIYWTITRGTCLYEVGQPDIGSRLPVGESLCMSKTWLIEAITEESKRLKKTKFIASQATEAESVRYCICQIARNKFQEIREELRKEDPSLLHEIKAFERKFKKEIRRVNE